MSTSPSGLGLSSTDLGDGTYAVPLLDSDVPDPCVARVPAAESGAGTDVYYMVSTTMHLSPGAPVMRSYDLVSWEIVSYAFDVPDDDGASLRHGRNGYGQGQWAASLRYRDGMFYVVLNTNNLGGAYLLRTDDVEQGTWEQVPLGRPLHDPSLFFDEADGATPYVFYGSGEVSAVRLSDDLTEIVEELPRIVTVDDHPGEPSVGGLFEGVHVHLVDGRYYLVVITWPPGQDRQVVMFRSEHLLGRYATADGSDPYEVRGVLDSDGFAQGGLVEVPDGAGGYRWWGMFFRDTYPLGRVPALVPAVWQDGWPTFGRDGAVHVGDTFAVPITLPPRVARRERLKGVVASDLFDGPGLDLAWQWNHAPDDRCWSLGARPGWLRLTTGHVVSGRAEYTKAPGRGLTYLEEARNTLSQRTFGPTSSAEIRMDVAGMRDGDVAGLAVYARSFVYAAVRQDDGGRTLGIVRRLQPFDDAVDADAVESFVPGATVPLGDRTEVHLKLDADFAAVPGELWVTCAYSLDGVRWEPLGEPQGPLVMDWSLSHFVAHRFGIFSYALTEPGGVVDIDHYLLSRTLGTGADTTALDELLAEAQGLDAAGWSPGSWAAVETALARARSVRAPSTQNQVDAPAHALASAIAALEPVRTEAAPPSAVRADTRRPAPSGADERPGGARPRRGRPR